jgi:hypothetical protein
LRTGEICGYGSRAISPLRAKRARNRAERVEHSAAAKFGKETAQISEFRRIKRTQIQHYFGSWKVNSADADGCIMDDDGATILLIPDRRLRALLLQAWLHMALRHPIRLLR